MWSRIRSSDVAKIEKYANCYRQQNGRPHTKAQLKSQIETPGRSLHIFEGNKFNVGVQFSDRDVVTDVTLAGQIAPNMVAKLLVEKCREHALKNTAVTLKGETGARLSAETTKILKSMENTPGVKLTQKPSRPGFIEVTIHFDMRA